MSDLRNAFDTAVSLVSFDELSPAGSISPEKDSYIDLNERSGIEPLSYYVRENEIRHSSAAEPESDPNRIFFVRQSGARKRCDNYVMDLADEGALLHRDFLIVNKIVTDPYGPVTLRLQLSPIMFRDGCFIGHGHTEQNLSFWTSLVTTNCKRLPATEVASAGAHSWSGHV